MKKNVSLFMAAIVLIGAVMVFTGCGKLTVQSGQVYQKQGEGVYTILYFAPDGTVHAKLIYPIKGQEEPRIAKIGTYTIDKETVTMKINYQPVSYTFDNSCLTVQGNIPDDLEKMCAKKYILASPYIEDEIKNAVKK